MVPEVPGTFFTFYFSLLPFPTQKTAEPNHTNTPINIYNFSCESSILSIRNRIEGIMVKPNPVYDIIFRTSFIIFKL